MNEKRIEIPLGQARLGAVPLPVACVGINVLALLDEVIIDEVVTGVECGVVTCDDVCVGVSVLLVRLLVVRLVVVSVLVLVDGAVSQNEPK